MIHFTSDNLNRYIAFKLGVERLNFDIFELSKLKELEIDPCADNLYFEVSSDIFKYFVSLETLTIKNMPCDESFLNEILKLQNLKSLRLVNSSVFDIEKLSTKKLTTLILNNTYINNMDKLSIFNLIEYLAIDNTDIKDISFLNDMMKLKVLIIDNNFYDNNKKLINSLIKRNVCVLENGIHNLSYKEFEV